MSPARSNLCAECRNADDSMEYRHHAVYEEPVCLYKRPQFPRATKCPDYEPREVEDK